MKKSTQFQIHNLLFFAISLVLFSCGKTTQEDREITLLSYNIFHGEFPYNMGNSNLEAIAELIKEINPDFVALQEVDSMTNRTAGFNDGQKIDITKSLAEMTGMHGHFAKAIDYSDGGYGEAVLSKAPATMTSINLSSPAGGEGRSMAIATLTLENGLKLSFGGTHLCHEFDANREAQTKEISDYLSSLGHAAILAGDLNFIPETPHYDYLTENWLDAAKEFGNTDPTYSSIDPKRKIDYIWLSKGSDWEITEVKVIPISHSDHMPVLVKVKLSK